MRPIPQSLQIVAWLFIIGGISSAIEMVSALFAHRISINFGVLTIFIGYGLLRFNPRSLSWALFFIWLGLILTPIVAIVFLFTPGNLTLFGVKSGSAPPGLGFVLCVAAFALIYWQYRVLTNREIRELFV